MAAITYRTATDDEFEAFFTPTITAFGSHLNPRRVEKWRPALGTGLSVGALDGDRWVGGASALVDDLVLPGGAALPAALVTMVGVLPTHRRRGILRELMRRQLDEIAAKRLPLAALIASESVIYGRYGYGPATWSARYEIDTADASFATEPPSSGLLRLLDKADAADALREAYDRCLATRPGGVGRSVAFWNTILDDPKEDRHGASALFLLCHEDETGRPDGAALYRVKLRFDPSHNLADGTLLLVELFGATPDVEAQLWRAVFDVDLIRRVQVLARPVDDPLRWRLVEPRRLRTTGTPDWLWVRVLDVPRALGSRSYGTPGELVLETSDPLRAEGAGTFRLRADDDGVSAERTSAAADLRLGISELGSLLLGGVAPSTLAAAGRLQATDATVLRRADAMFLSPTAPFCATDF